MSGTDGSSDTKSSSAISGNVGAQLAVEAHYQAIVQMLGDQFAGTVVNSNGSIDVLVSGKLQPTFSRFQTLSTSANPIKMVQVPESLATLKSLANKITADQTEWNAQGVYFTEWGANPPNGTVDVSLLNYTAESATAIETKYGSLVRVKVGSSPAPRRLKKGAGVLMTQKLEPS